jgi:hypothetical protein
LFVVVGCERDARHHHERSKQKAVQERLPKDGARYKNLTVFIQIRVLFQGNGLIRDSGMYLASDFPGLSRLAIESWKASPGFSPPARQRGALISLMSLQLLF